jgi:SAM-dependent methyltransferase
VTSQRSHHGHDHQGAGSPVVFDAAFWDERYRSSKALWTGNPNPHLVSEAAELLPRTALDVGCGEGADAIWLAEHGWQVTAVDISAVALERGVAQARRLGTDVAQRIIWLQADINEYVPIPESLDFVSAQFMCLPKVQRELLHRRLATSVAPGGTLLVVGHHPSDRQTSIPRPPMPELFFTASDVADSLDANEWVVLVDESRARSALDPQGRTVTIHDTVMRARRKG